jgi:hypothetical protein
MIADGPGPRARAELCEDWEQPDAIVSKLADASPQIVARARAQLEGLGVIPARPAALSDDAFSSGPQILRGKAGADRCRAALRDDATRSNAEIAESEHVTTAQVAGVRRALENLGAIATQPVPPARFPEHVPLPRSPRVLMEGACVGHPDARWWVSDNQGERELARRVCDDSCHVKAPCLSWALRAIPASDTSIYGGTTAAARRRLRRALGIVRQNSVVMINAAKTACPSCGEALSGQNLITEPGRRPGTVRRRCRACTQRRKREAYQRPPGRAGSRWRCPRDGGHWRFPRDGGLTWPRYCSPRSPRSAWPTSPCAGGPTWTGGDRPHRAADAGAVRAASQLGQPARPRPAGHLRLVQDHGHAGGPGPVRRSAARVLGRMMGACGRGLSGGAAARGGRRSGSGSGCGGSGYQNPGGAVAPLPGGAGHLGAGDDDPVSNES